MCSRKLIYISFTFIAVQLNVFANTNNVYYPSLVNNEYDCDAAAGGIIQPDDYCIIDCNTKATAVHCGKSKHCMLRCNVDRCFDGATLYASDALELTVSSIASECMRESTIYAPNYGNASFYIASTANSIHGTFKQMTVNDGSHTNKIEIDCSDNKEGDNKACRYLTVNAQNSQYLEINADDNASMGYATINCPQTSSYIEVEPEAPCVINAEGKNVIATNMRINTKNGSPQDFVFHGSVSGIFTGSVLTCDAGMSVIDGNTFDVDGDCYMMSITSIMPSTSIPTTRYPTKAPSSFPTFNPTSIPTPNPSYSTTTKSPTLFAEQTKTSETISFGTSEMLIIETTKRELIVDDKFDEKSDELDMMLYISIGVALSVLAIILCRCLFVMSKSKKQRIKSMHGEPARHSILSQDIAKSDDENITAVDDDDIELPLEIHLCMQTSDGMDEAEGNISWSMDTPQMPPLQSQLSEEEVNEIKRNYEKKKSTLSMEEIGDYVKGHNVLMDIKMNDLKRDHSNSEELYDDNYGKRKFLVLTRHDTLQSDGTDTSISGNPTKCTEK